MILAILLRGEACVLLEKTIEVGIVIVSQKIGNGLDGQVGSYENQFGLFQLALGYVSVGGLARGVLKDADKVVFRHTGLLRQLAYIQSAL